MHFSGLAATKLSDAKILRYWAAVASTPRRDRLVRHAAATAPVALGSAAASELGF